MQAKQFCKLSLSLKYIGNHKESNKIAILAKETSETFPSDQENSKDLSFQTSLAFLLRNSRILEEFCVSFEKTDDAFNLAVARMYLGIILSEEKSFDKSISLQTSSLSSFIHLRFLFILFYLNFFYFYF